MIRAALFDIGGVLTSSPFDAFAAYERDHGLPEGLLRGINAADSDTNAWARLERGELDLVGFDRAFAEESGRAGYRVAGYDVLQLLQGEPRPTMIEAVVRCSGTLATALLTNNFIPLADSPRADWLSRALEVVDVVVESSVEGVRKPDVEFYERALSRLGVEATECVFLDDIGTNLKPARALGMTTVKVADPDRALAELGSIVGLDLK